MSRETPSKIPQFEETILHPSGSLVLPSTDPARLMYRGKANESEWVSSVPKDVEECLKKIFGEATVVQRGGTIGQDTYGFYSFGAYADDVLLGYLKIVSNSAAYTTQRPYGNGGVSATMWVVGRRVDA